jgi:hypothetical protein
MKVARILLGLILLSALLVPLIEIGHSLLHGFENPFHYHKVHALNKNENHTVKKHHFPKMKFAHEMEEKEPCGSFLILLFCFLHPISELNVANNSTQQKFYPVAFNHYTPSNLLPPYRPPVI